jgi:hypothetical protein
MVIADWPRRISRRNRTVNIALPQAQRALNIDTHAAN